MAFEHFTRISRPGWVIFGQGSISALQEEIDRWGARRPLILSTPDQRAEAEKLALVLGNRKVGVFDKDVCTFRSSPRVKPVQFLGSDCAVAIDGGLTTELGKVLALEPGHYSQAGCACAQRAIPSANKKARTWAGQKKCIKGVMNWRFTCTKGESRTFCIHPRQLTRVLDSYVIDFIDN